MFYEIHYSLPGEFDFTFSHPRPIEHAIKMDYHPTLKQAKARLIEDGLFEAELIDCYHFNGKFGVEIPFKKKEKKTIFSLLVKVKWEDHASIREHWLYDVSPTLKPEDYHEYAIDYYAELDRSWAIEKLEVLGYYKMNIKMEKI